MDALTFLLDSLAIVVLVVWGLKDDKRINSGAMTSIFRYRELASPPVRAGGNRAAPIPLTGGKAPSRP